LNRGDEEEPVEPMSKADQGEPGLRVPRDGPLARALVDAIHAGEIEVVRTLVTENQGLASARLIDDKGGSGTALHAATDWPGYFRNGPEIISLLIEAGADPSAPVEGSWHAETPLHWAASSDDVEVARALIDGGANIEAMGASLGGGTPLDDAVGYGCWHVARLLVERGAPVDLGQAAGLGLMARVEALLATDPPNPQELTDAFWIACHGGQRRMAELLLDRGADVNGTPSWGGTSTPLEAANSQDTGREALVAWLKEQGATTSLEPGNPP
jgi:ankyrin repeat protein